MPIYLDHAATTPLRREVLDAMLPLLTESFGNPSSAHAYGRAARAALDELVRPGAGEAGVGVAVHQPRRDQAPARVEQDRGRGNLDLGPDLRPRPDRQDAPGGHGQLAVGDRPQLGKSSAGAGAPVVAGHRCQLADVLQ